MQFELKHLDSYDDASLLKEVCRVATLLPDRKLSKVLFVKHSKVHSSTLEKRFGSWGNALKQAGLSARYDDSNHKYSREHVLGEIKGLAERLGKKSITLQEFRAHSGIDGAPVRRLFGSWASALQEAELSQSVLGKRYDDEQCYENMLNVWVHYGRPPQHNEMNEFPSIVGSKAYIRRWGTWRKALSAFAERANRGEALDGPESVQHKEESSVIEPKLESLKKGSREVPLALRYFVLRRDLFRCVTCGKSPANDMGTILHVDHIHPWSLGGATIASNLRTLCLNCNLGKGASAA